MIHFDTYCIENDVGRAAFLAFLKEQRTDKAMIEYFEKIVGDESLDEEPDVSENASCNSKLDTAAFDDLDLPPEETEDDVKDSESETDVFKSFSTMHVSNIRIIDETAVKTAACKPLTTFDLSPTSVLGKAVLCQLPAFVGSCYYEQWIEYKMGLSFDRSGRQSRLIDLFAGHVSVEHFINSKQSLSKTEMNDLVAGKKVDQCSLLGAVEDLPICVCLATANVNIKGFPLIYVNKAFESVTQYPRSEIIGKNCKFLQEKGPTEAEVIQKMVHCLHNALPVKVVITNYRKNGEKFKNALGMKPVFDTKGVYRFVVGIQFDVDAPSSGIDEMNLIDDLLMLFPNMVDADNDI